MKAKLEAVVAIGNMRPEKVYFKIRSAELQKDESDEVWYDNKLYDVAKRESVNGTEYVYLMRDEEEQDVLTKNSEYFKNDTGINIDTGCTLNPQKKNQSITDNHYITAFSKKIFYNNDALADPVIKCKTGLSSICAEVITPPPRLS